jgi:2',3'-cyclic-nucleotide 2'-phosphodiesterase (5'-nucleotidase family)
MLLCSLVAALGIAGACKRSASQAPELPTTPTLRVYVASTIAGALEPCGCRKDMLGGVDHAAALIADGKKEAPNSILLSAGPTLFLNPDIEEGKRTQDTWKAHSIAQALADMGLVAFTPGANDFALGTVEFAPLAAETKATALAANVKAGGVPLGKTRVVQENGFKVGIAGVSQPKSKLGAPQGVEIGDLEPALRAALAELHSEGAQINIALVASDRGLALRVAERVTGYQLMILGKSSDRGDGNDAPTAPVMIGKTLVVEAPNHLQALGVVDLFVRDHDFDFQDAAGLQEAEERQSLERRSEELSRRIAHWEKDGVRPDDVAARKVDLQKMRARLVQLAAPPAPKQGSFFRFALKEVREEAGSNPDVSARMSKHYERVNDYNKELFKDRKPKPVAKGESSYIGVEGCEECHEEAVAFWKKTKHAGAYKTLSDDHKEFNLDCVNCHVTGYERPGGSTVTFVENLKDVQCEECHGPGSRHAETEDTDFITLRPEKTLCQKCHHTPHVADDWNADDAWPHIVGEGHGEDSKP